MFYNLVSGKFNKSQIDTISTNEKNKLIMRYFRLYKLGMSVDEIIARIDMTIELFKEMKLPYDDLIIVNRFFNRYKNSFN